MATRRLKTNVTYLEIDPETAMRQKRGMAYYVLSVFIPIVVFIFALAVLVFFIVIPLMQGFYLRNEPTSLTLNHPTNEAPFLLTLGPDPFHQKPGNHLGSGHGNRFAGGGSGGNGSSGVVAVVAGVIIVVVVVLIMVTKVLVMVVILGVIAVVQHGNAANKTNQTHIVKSFNIYLITTLLFLIIFYSL